MLEINVEMKLNEMRFFNIWGIAASFVALIIILDDWTPFDDLLSQFKSW